MMIMMTMMITIITIIIIIIIITRSDMRRDHADRDAACPTVAALSQAAR